MALKEAYETIDKQWLAQGASLKGFVYQRDWNNNQKRYGYWLLMKSHHIRGLTYGKAIVPLHFPLQPHEYRPVCNSLRRQFHRMKFSSARVKKAYSFALDSDMYSYSGESQENFWAMLCQKVFS